MNQEPRDKPSRISKTINFGVANRNRYDFVIEKARYISNNTDLEKPEKIKTEEIMSLVKEISEQRDGFIDRMMIDSAIFYTDKLVFLTKDDPENCKLELYRWAKLLHEKGEYYRAAFALNTKNSYHIKDLSCRHLAAKCYVSQDLFFIANVHIGLINITNRSMPKILKMLWIFCCCRSKLISVSTMLRVPKMNGEVLWSF